MISRRFFLKNGAFAMVSLGFAPSFLSRTALAAGVRAKRLIAIFQRGAVDGLSVVVPFGDAEYYRSRPSIAIARPGADDAAISLDGFFGFNPRLRALKPFWDNRALAIVHACGSPDNTRSHFDAQDYMETATPGIKSTGDGWLNRYLQAKREQDATPFRAVAVANQLPRMLQGPAPSIALHQVDQFGIRAGQQSDKVSALFERAYGVSPNTQLNVTGREAFEAIKMLQGANPAQYQPDHGADYPRSPFGQALKQIAQLAKAGVGLEVAFADLGGWDTHVNQGGAQGQLATNLTGLGRGLSVFAQALGAEWKNTVVVVLSEFGRTFRENGNRGTDHGHGTVYWVLGGGIDGGRIAGNQVRLERATLFQDRDYPVLNDYRAVLGGLFRGLWGLSAEQSARIFPQTTPADLHLV